MSTTDDRSPQEITLSVKDAMQQIQRSLPDHQSKVTLPVVSSQRTALLQIADVFPEDGKVILIKQSGGRSRGSRLYHSMISQQDRPPEALASTSQNFSVLTVRNPERPLPEFKPRPSSDKAKARSKALYEKAKACMENEPFVQLAVLAFDTSLIRIPYAQIQLLGVDAEEGDPTAIIDGGTYPVLWDTGCSVTSLPIDLVAPTFRDYIQSPAYPASSANGKIISVDAVVRLSNTDVHLSFPARVVEKLPNDLKGVLLGQVGCIDSVQVLQTPAAFAGGRQSGEWGTMDIRAYIDGDDNIVEVQGIDE